MRRLLSRPTEHDRQEVDLSRPHRLSPRVGLRPEPFGALAYHFDNRRLVFLRSLELVELVRDLERHPTASDAIAAHSGDGPGAPRASRRYAAALSSLAEAEVICER